MIKLHSGNVLLKPAQRRQIATLLRRCVRLGQRLGDFVLNISMRRAGRFYELVAKVHDRAGDFACRCRQNNWQDALRQLAKDLTHRLHEQRLRFATSMVTGVA
jgi:hypothetical protein